MSGQAPNDRELDAFLAEDSALTRAYRSLPRAEPSAALDAAILANARAALASAPTRRVRRPGWFIGLATAATVVLAAGIGIRLGNQATLPDAAQAPRVQSAEKKDRNRADVVEIIPLPAKPIADDSPIPAAPEPMPASAPPALAAPPAPPPPPAIETFGQRAAQEMARKSTAGPEASGSQTAPQTSDHGSYAKQPGQRQIPVPIGAAAPGYDREASDARDNAQSGADADPTAFPEEADATTAKSKIGEGGARGEYRRAVTTPTESKPPAASRPAPSREPETAAAAGLRATGAAASKEELPKDKAETPAHWIARIRKLLRDRQHETALTELQLFRAQHPDYSLPADLRDLGQ